MLCCFKKRQTFVIVNICFAYLRFLTWHFLWILTHKIPWENIILVTYSIIISLTGAVVTYSILATGSQVVIYEMVIYQVTKSDSWVWFFGIFKHKNHVHKHKTLVLTSMICIRSNNLFGYCFRLYIDKI